MSEWKKLLELKKGKTQEIKLIPKIETPKAEEPRKERKERKPIKTPLWEKLLLKSDILPLLTILNMDQLRASYFTYFNESDKHKLTKPELIEKLIEKILEEKGNGE